MLTLELSGDGDSQLSAINRPAEADTPNSVHFMLCKRATSLLQAGHHRKAGIELAGDGVP